MSAAATRPSSLQVGRVLTAARVYLRELVSPGPHLWMFLSMASMLLGIALFPTFGRKLRPASGDSVVVLTSMGLAAVLAAAAVILREHRAGVRDMLATWPLLRSEAALAELLADCGLGLMWGALLALLAPTAAEAVLAPVITVGGAALGHVVARLVQPMWLAAAITSLCMALAVIFVPTSRLIGSSAVVLLITAVGLSLNVAVRRNVSVHVGDAETSWARRPPLLWSFFSRLRSFPLFCACHLGLLGLIAMEVISGSNSPSGSRWLIQVQVAAFCCVAGIEAGRLFVGPMAELVLTRPISARTFRGTIVVVGLIVAACGPLWRAIDAIGQADERVFADVRSLAEHRTGRKEWAETRAQWQTRYEHRLSRAVGLTTFPAGALVANLAPGGPPVVPGPPLLDAFRVANAGTYARRLVYGCALFIFGVPFGVLIGGRKGSRVSTQIVSTSASVAMLGLGGALAVYHPQGLFSLWPGGGPWLPFSLLLAAGGAWLTRRWLSRSAIG